MRKKQLLLLAVCITCFSAGFAQNTSAPVGAEWHFAGDNYNYMDWVSGLEPDVTWNDHATSTGDTVVAGISRRKLEVTRTERSGAGSGTWSSISCETKNTFYL